VAVAWAVASALSGAPSTAWAAATGRDPLEAARAAGAPLVAITRQHLARRRELNECAAGLVVHLAVSAFWTAVLAVVLRPRGRLAGALGGAAAGLGIAALDLGVVARRLPALHALPQAPQWADNVAFGAPAGAVLGGGRGRRHSRHP
jgi:hypothetical protein